MLSSHRLAAAATAFAFCLPVSAAAQAALTDLRSPFPTLENLSVTWQISGDPDRDGEVEVRYRAVDEDGFRQGFPLRRIPAGSGDNGFSWPEHFSGSIFDLVPDTEYEIQVAFSDPDGGSHEETMMVRTRPVPAASADGRAVSVTPATMAAALADAQPGDLITLADGEYEGFTVETSGTLEEPIVFRGENRTGAIVTGQTALEGQSHIFIENMTLRSRIKLNGTEGIVVRECDIRTDRDGIVAFGAGTINGYFADNIIQGPYPWEEAMLGVAGGTEGEGINVTGPGNVIAYNRIDGFRDCISLLEGDEAVNQQSIDIIGNDVSLGLDDGIEADFSFGNVRVIRNRVRDSFIGISSQPSLGGPTYFIRNTVYNALHVGFKLYRGSDGDVILHNTVIKVGDALGLYPGRTITNAYIRNNLFIGGEGGREFNGFSSGDGAVINTTDMGASSSHNYNGYGSIGTGEFAGRLGEVRFGSLEELRAMTSETNAQEVDMGIFAAGVSFVAAPMTESATMDLRLGPASSAVDTGEPLVGINDGFAGAAPDLGAYEAGSALPGYGPRDGSAPPVCGDGVREGVEECDDGNMTDLDGCSAACRLERMTEDGGFAGIDAGPGVDGGAGSDGGTTGSDGGATGDDASGGCGCHVVRAKDAARSAFWIAGLALLAFRRRRR